MNDKERILMTILHKLSSTQGLVRKHQCESDFHEKGFIYTHFGMWDDRDIEVGDLVMGQTSQVFDFKVGFVHQIYNQNHIVVREIGSNKTCDFSNERFLRIIGLSEIDTLEGDKYLFYLKVLKAFRKADEVMYLFNGIHFLDNNLVEISIRQRYGYIDGSIPFSFVIKWNKRMSIKRIIEAMRENGYGTRLFDKVESNT